MSTAVNVGEMCCELETIGNDKQLRLKVLADCF